jgi:hypothetical protein
MQYEKTCVEFFPSSFVPININSALTLMTLLRIPFLGRIGCISYVLPIRQNIDILNRDIRVETIQISCQQRGGLGQKMAIFC